MESDWKLLRKFPKTDLIKYNYSNYLVSFLFGDFRSQELFVYRTGNTHEIHALGNIKGLLDDWDDFRVVGLTHSCFLSSHADESLSCK